MIASCHAIEEKVYYVTGDHVVIGGKAYFMKNANLAQLLQYGTHSMSVFGSFLKPDCLHGLCNL